MVILCMWFILLYYVQDIIIVVLPITLYYTHTVCLFLSHVFKLLDTKIYVGINKASIDLLDNNNNNMHDNKAFVSIKRSVASAGCQQKNMTSMLLQNKETGILFFFFFCPQIHPLVMLSGFWLAGGQRSIKSVRSVVVPLNIWHFCKPYIMQLCLSACLAFV